MHYHYIEDDNGELTDLVPLCSDSCHRDYCQQTDGNYYLGWNGAHEGSEGTEFCALCGVVAGGLELESCQLANVVVNRFVSVDGDKCKEHEPAHWLQLPATRLERLERNELVAGHSHALQRAEELRDLGWVVVVTQHNAEEYQRVGAGSAHYNLLVTDEARGPTEPVA